MAQTLQLRRTIRERDRANRERDRAPSHPLLADLLRSDALVLDRLKLHGEARRARDRAVAISAPPRRETITTWFLRRMAEPGIDRRTEGPLRYGETPAGSGCAH
jgi:hypothetical protein